MKIAKDSKKRFISFVFSVALFLRWIIISIDNQFEVSFLNATIFFFQSVLEIIAFWNSGSGIQAQRFFLCINLLVCIYTSHSRLMEWGKCEMIVFSSLCQYFANSILSALRLFLSIGTSPFHPRVKYLRTDELKNVSQHAKQLRIDTRNRMQL